MWKALGHFADMFSASMFASNLASKVKIVNAGNCFVVFAWNATGL